MGWAWQLTAPAERRRPRRWALARGAVGVALLGLGAATFVVGGSGAATDAWSAVFAVLAVAHLAVSYALARTRRGQERPTKRR